ncbi:MAG TPA: hypothetical protein ENK47_05775 [Euryarchaeota archaeon]|nr:hypothetical protein [Euryarchaeota archaeon]
MMTMTKLGNVKVIYLADGKRKSAGGQGEDMGAFIKVNLNPSKRRTKFNTVLIPWANVVKVIVLE